MAERSSKHNPRIDEEMKKESQSLTSGAPIEARAEEHLEKEGPADDHGTHTPSQHGTPEGMTPEDVEARSELARFIDETEFPASRSDLIESAQDHHAPDRVVRTLTRLPDDSFDNVQAVWSALGGGVEEKRS